MVELTLSEGLTPSSPLAFAYYGQMLMTSGNLAEGCRLGMSSCIMTVGIFAEMCSLCVAYSTPFSPFTLLYPNHREASTEIV